ncbi:Long-chain-fatty-acid--CoA ligase [Phycicoccus elongatus Lp2]|uniref:Long-chain-fatty-acid--CoA ligase n=1 Tax=Phycicoccus elongatus Lp2 TaxID=1193181 RepID=N0E0P1_9MICO|nr:long-chain fatty acid--CoA ligase [Phycicoccus elongatus]CCH69225.1 Long-chain-fatty-acid--CoA ligase [Phycicoccus elongatus Lp2]
MSNLAANLTSTAAASPQAPALRLGDVIVTFAELQEQAARVAAVLDSRGVGVGDRVAMMLPNVLAFPAIFYGILRAGAIAVPLNPLLKSGEVEYMLRDSGAGLLFGWEAMGQDASAGAAAAAADVILIGDAGLAPVIEGVTPAGAPVDRADDDTAVILFTSGTTGHPKGAELTHHGLDSNQSLTVRTLINLTADDVVMGCLPLFHIFGLTTGLNAAIGAGACLTMLPRFDPRAALDILAGHNVTVFEGVPTMYSAMLAAAGDDEISIPDLRICVSGGSALPVRVLEEFEERFGCIILEGYGLSETSPVASFNHPDRDRKPGSIGTPVEGVEMRLVDDERRPVAEGEPGEIQIRGANVMKGYWGRPDATALAIDADGWFSTGDIATRDEEGYYRIVDRKKDLILRGGYNVYPREVEEVLHQHPSVAEAAVVGVPHDSLGEEVAAAVALKPGKEATPEELTEFVRDRIAAYKYPRHVWIVDALPKSATGKILRREVRATTHAES